MSDDINVNMIADQLARKVDLPDNKGQDGIDYVVESKTPTTSDPTWYRVYKSGWIEQGGKKSATASELADKAYTFNLIKNITQLGSFSNHFIYTSSTNNWGAGSAGIMSFTTNSITIMSDGLNTTSPVVGFYWQVSGQGANQ